MKTNYYNVSINIAVRLMLYNSLKGLRSLLGSNLSCFQSYIWWSISGRINFWMIITMRLNFWLISIFWIKSVFIRIISTCWGVQLLCYEVPTFLNLDRGLDLELTALRNLTLFDWLSILHHRNRVLDHSGEHRWEVVLLPCVYGPSSTDSVGQSPPFSLLIPFTVILQLWLLLDHTWLTIRLEKISYIPLSLERVNLE